ncbi:hypothetical protein NBRC116188_24350 [Oceaniserpentilla sp. 4NH20-0058]|uniref:hypothetical protein n=1 Tax=Oceaniserpentilla sp. 4NH20-0058 TaxID=3127660 RepID=UPI003103A106
MKNVILHVGHGKTGSSYLQSVLALNTSYLLDAGILYPDHRSLSKAAKGLISSGNQGSLDIEMIEKADQNTVLFSGEALFLKMLKGDLLEALSKNYKLKVIMYTRDVIDNAISRWAQEVKRSGGTQDIDTYLNTVSVGPYPKVVEWIEKSKELNFELVLKNYSLHEKDLAAEFFSDVIGKDIDVSNLVLPKAEKVNRSLTHSENEIQRLFNIFDPESSSLYISDFLVNKFPDLESSSIKISKKTFRILNKKNSEYINKINEFTAENEKVNIGDEKELVIRRNADKSLPNEVLVALGESIKNKFSKKEDVNENQVKDGINTFKVLRDTALKIEKGAKLDLSDALELMKAAQELRPNGAVINQKVEEWSEKLASEETVEA